MTPFEELKRQYQGRCKHCKEYHYIKFPTKKVSYCSRFNDMLCRLARCNENFCGLEGKFWMPRDFSKPIAPDYIVNE